MPEREPDLNRRLAHTIKPTPGPAAPQLEALADAAQPIADRRAVSPSPTRSFPIRL
jgi:hypothetical protein